jgi:Tfp pilus assembly protein PilV
VGRNMQRRREPDRGATLVESLIAIVLCGIIVIGLVSALRTSIRSGRTTSEQAAIEGGLTDAAQLLERADYVRCPFLDASNTYQKQVVKAASNAGFRISSISIVSVDYWLAGTQDWRLGSTTTTSTTLPPTTTTNPMNTTTVPPVTTLVIDTSTSSTSSSSTTSSSTTSSTTTTEAPTTTIDGGGGGGASTTIVEVTTTTLTPTTTLPPTTTIPPTTTTRPRSLNFSGLDDIEVRGAGGRISASGSLVGMTASGLVPMVDDVDCSGANAIASSGPAQRIRLRATSNNGVTKDLLVVKSDD